MPLFKTFNRLKLLFQISLLYLIFIIGCNVDKSEYEYEAGLMDYFKNELKIEEGSLKEELFYITPLNGCEYCVKHNLYNISKVKDRDFTVIFVGGPMNSEIRNIHEKVVAKFKGKTIYDRDERIYFYDTGFGKPLLIHFKHTEIYYNLIIQDDLIDQASDYIKNTQ